MISGLALTKEEEKKKEEDGMTTREECVKEREST